MNRNALQSSAVLLGVALGISAVHVSRAQAVSSPTRTLLDKAHTLESKGRVDMAAQTWQQVLLADPNNVEALGGLARAAKLAGNQALANTYIQRLRAINPSDPGIARAEHTSSQSSQVAQLQKAGKLAEQGNYTQAMAEYRQVFGAQPPTGEWALAYYETEAATEEGRGHAVAGLRALAEKYPLDSRYQIALGRVLTYNPSTRAEGRRYLERHPDSAEAKEALKLSYTWDSRKSAGGARTYSGSFVPQRGAPSALQFAYAALNARRFDEADARFKAVLAKEPKNASALAGVGYVRMNQQNFTAALSYLEQAKSDGLRDPALEKNLQTSRFFATLGDAGIDLNENNLTSAEQKYQQALQMRPDSPEALLGLGGTLMKAGQPRAAIPYMERVVQLSPVLPAYRGLFLAHYQSGDAAGGLRIQHVVPAAIQAQLLRDPEYLRSLAGAYSAVGQDAEAQHILKSALDLPFPSNGAGLKAEARLQYASLLLDANRGEQAAGLYRQVLAEDPRSVLAWQGLVNAQHAAQSDGQALQSIESMPPGVYDQALRDPGFLSLVASIYQANGKLDLAQSLLDRAIAARTTTGQAVPVAVQVQLAGLYLQRKDAVKAIPIYQSVLHEHPDRMDAWRGLLDAMHTSGRDQDAAAQIQQIPGPVRAQLENNADYLQVVAQVYTTLGRSRLAQSYIDRVQRKYALQHLQPPAAVDIQNAWLFYNAMNDRALYRQLLALGGRSDLSDDQRRVVQTIWAQWAVRKANQASAANHQKRALSILNAAATSFPDNPTVIKALASGYVQAGMAKEAIAIFQAEDMTSASATDYKAAVGAALAGNDLKDAENWLRYGLVKYPRDGGILSLAAKFEQARGDAGKAEVYYRAALAALPADKPTESLASLLHSSLGLNPRGLPTEAQAQDLASLLSPSDDNGQTMQQETRPYLPGGEDESATTFSQAMPRQPVRSLVPSYMTNPSASQGTRLRDYTPPGDAGQQPRSANEYILAPLGADAPEFAMPAEAVSSAAAVASSRDAGQGRIRRTNQGAVPAPGSSSEIASKAAVYKGEVYGPFIPYVAPTMDAALSYQASNIEFPSTTIYTDFPVTDAASAPLTSAGRITNGGRVEHNGDAAAEAAEVRRHQSDPPGYATGVSASDEIENLSTGQNVQYNPLTTPPPGQIPRPGASSVPAAAREATGQQGVTKTVQQYSRPVRRTVATARRRTVRRATEVGGFGPGSAPVYYPALPTEMSSQPYPDLPSASRADQSAPTDDDLIARELPPLRGRGTATDANGYAVAGPPLTERQQVERDLATLEASYSGWVGGSAFTRVRSGEPGIDRLQDYEVPFEASVVAGKSVRFSVIPRAVFLTSGTIDNTRYGGNFIPYLGTLPANAANAPAPQSASGIGGEFQVVTQNFGAAVGYTPYEFLVHNVTGRLRYRPAGGPFTIFGERDSIKQTQLSYAGLRDPGSISLTNAGNIWGGVISSGGGVRFDHGNERAGFYVGAAGAVLTGYHTLDNSSVEGTGGAYFRIHQFPGYGSLNIGANLFAEHYAHNERALTYGNGGYFSPNVYFLGSVPVTFSGNYKTDWHYVIQASLGVQTFQESSAPFFPLPEDAARQNAAYSGCTIPQIAARTCLSAELPFNSNTGLNFGINAETSYRLTEHWFAGAALAANNTNNYNQVQPTVFLRYLFKPQYSTDEYPTGLFPTDGFRPLRVP